MAGSSIKTKNTKKTKYQLITEKILPHVTIDFRTGKRDQSDFRALLKRLNELGELNKNELQYALSNFRLIVLTLGLFHYLPELIENESNLERFFSQIVHIMQDRYLSKSTARTREQFLNEIVTKLKAEIIASPIATTMFTGDIIDLFDFLKVQINETIENSFDDLNTAMTAVIPRILDNFKEKMLASGRYSSVLYDIATVTRKLKHGEINDIGTLMHKIDSWEKKYTKPEDYHSTDKGAEKSSFTESRPVLKPVERKQKIKAVETSSESTTTDQDNDKNASDYFSMLRSAINSAVNQTEADVGYILRSVIPKILTDFKEKMISRELISSHIIYDIDSTSRSFANGSLSSLEQLNDKLNEWEGL
ncbi:MAG: hypothetical protein ACTSP4_04280 [Candidatus Hodarchaeales archaeon]